MTYQVTNATQEDVDQLKGNLRQGDFEEIQAASGRDPGEALEWSWRKSELCWAFRRDGKPVLLAGAARTSLISDVGVPWMLGSWELDVPSVGNEVAKRTRYYVGEMKSRFSKLENWIDSRQSKSIRWLKWVGFTIEEPIPFGVAGLPFHRFWLIN